MPGIIQSVTTICGWVSTASASASRPLLAHTTTWPSAPDSTPSIMQRVVGSSSTSSTRSAAAPSLFSSRIACAADMCANEGSAEAGTRSSSPQVRHCCTRSSTVAPSCSASRPILPPSSSNSAVQALRSLSPASPRSATRRAR